MEFSENKPIYLQLADQIMDSVERHDLIAEDRLLSVREYSAQRGVNANTVMRTYTWLQQEGIIFNKRGIGYFLSSEAKDIVRNIRTKEFYEKDMPYFFERLTNLNINAEELSRLYSEYIDKKK